METIQVDLSNCTHWNRMIKVKSDRIGQMGYMN
jgi:hypothetical protein